jgi:cystathionine beta-synthase
VRDRDELLGFVTEATLLRHLANGTDQLATPVGMLCESDYATVTPQTRIEVLQQLLADARLTIVRDGSEIVAILTKIDLIEYLARRHDRRDSPRASSSDSGAHRSREHIEVS